MAPWQRNVVMNFNLIYFILLFLSEEKRKQEKTKYWSNFNFFTSALFGHMLKEKNQHIHFLVYCHSSWSTFGLHVVRGPKTFVN